MTSIIDLWRAVDPEARRVSGPLEGLLLAARGVLRSRTAEPHLPPRVDGELLVVDASLLGGRPLDALLATLEEGLGMPKLGKAKTAVVMKDLFK